jgi:uncharacterized membrane protein YvlD (DUF360 family)
MTYITIIIGFLISLLISTIIIYIAIKIMGQEEGFWAALLTSLIGTLIYTLAYYLLGTGLWAALIGGFAWLIAIRYIYHIGWIKSIIIAILIWIITSLVSLLYPVIKGALL